MARSTRCKNAFASLTRSSAACTDDGGSAAADGVTLAFGRCEERRPLCKFWGDVGQQLPGVARPALHADPPGWCPMREYDRHDAKRGKVGRQISVAGTSRQLRFGKGAARAS